MNAQLRPGTKVFPVHLRHHNNPQLNITTSNRRLLVSLVLFLIFGMTVWAIAIWSEILFPGNDLFPAFIRSFLMAGLLAMTFYLNYKLAARNELGVEALIFRPGLVKQYLGGIFLGFLLPVTIWTITYLFFPFEILKNADAGVDWVTVVISYCLGNTLEELLFRGFLLLAALKLFGKTGGVIFVSLLFGLFHLPGLGFTQEGLVMIMTTFSMSLLFIAVIFYTRSIWTAVFLHITGNLLLHTVGFDGGTGGLLLIKFSAPLINGAVITVIYETVVVGFALCLFFKSKQHSLFQELAK
jgi:membrane protease YdiL (CAAX protease family)